MDRNYVTNWVIQLKKCVLPLAIMEILQKEDYYGYLLNEILKKEINMNISEGSIYPILIRLHSDGLVEYKWVEQKTGIPRKYYTLTEAGIKALNEMKQTWSQINSVLNK
jgi:PadR family transcriptional regulator PadR